MDNNDEGQRTVDDQFEEAVELCGLHVQGNVGHLFVETIWADKITNTAKHILLLLSLSHLQVKKGTHFYIRFTLLAHLSL